MSRVAYLNDVSVFQSYALIFIDDRGLRCLNIPVSERPFTSQEMKQASAVFLIGTTTLAKAVNRIDQEIVIA